MGLLGGVGFGFVLEGACFFALVCSAVRQAQHGRPGAGRAAQQSLRATGSERQPPTEAQRAQELQPCLAQSAPHLPRGLPGESGHNQEPARPQR